jgi:hypothetical protein
VAADAAVVTFLNGGLGRKGHVRVVGIHVRGPVFALSPEIFLTLSVGDGIEITEQAPQHELQRSHDSEIVHTAPRQTDMVKVA